MPTEATGIIDVVQELGTSASALIFFAWLIIFILKQHDKEKTQLRHDAEKKDEMMMEDDMVAEITRRVTARLQKESKDDATADELAERIIQRIKGMSDQ